jgi:hypothetical protein
MPSTIEAARSPVIVSAAVSGRVSTAGGAAGFWACSGRPEPSPAGALQTFVALERPTPSEAATELPRKPRLLLFTIYAPSAAHVSYGRLDLTYRDELIYQGSLE